MKLPFTLPFGKKEVKNYFLALLLQDEKVGAVVFEETNGMMHVVGRSEEHFLTSLNEVSFEELLDTVDKAVSTAEETLPENIQTEKTVFGVKQDWVLDGKIKKDYLATLKKMCDELALTPIGFLVFTEAIIHLLSQEEGAPVSAVLVEIGKKIISISLIRAGRIIETKQVPLEEPIVHAVDSALKHFADIEVLPSRIVLFNQENNEKLSQSFIKHTWSKTLPFLHVPQVTILPAGFETKGILTGTAAQMGFNVTGEDTIVPLTTRKKSAEKGIEKEEESFAFAKHEDLETKQASVKPDLTPEIEPTEAEEEELEQEAIEEPKKPHTKAKSSVLNENVSADFFGFVENQDITGSKKKPIKINNDNFETPANFDEAFAEIPEEVKEEETFENTASGGLPLNGMLLFAGVKKGLQTLPWGKLVSIFHIKLPSKKRTPKIKQTEDQEESSSSHAKIYAIAIAVFVIIIGGIIAYILTISANVTLFVTPKVISDSQPITFSTNGTTNAAQNIIAAQTTSVDEKGTLSEGTTGTKSIGNPAKGQVTIFNLSTSPASLSANTTIVSENGKKFTLDSDVSVPAADPYSGTGGKATVNVTAADIGPDYNLPSGTKFSIGSSSNIGAKNDNPFSGGTKQDINVVASADIDKIQQDLIKNLEDKAKADLQSKADGSTILPSFFTSETISNKNLSNKAGDQAKNLTLSATVTYETVTIKKSDIDSYTKDHLKDQLQTNGTLTANGLSTTVTDIKQNKDTTTATLNMKATLLPSITISDLAQKIAGKSFTQATSMLNGINSVADVSIKLVPNIPFLPKVLPRLPQHIHISVSANE